MRRIFWGFCRNWFLIDPLHYLSSRSDFGFEFTEKRLPDSAIGGVGDSPTRRVGESANLARGKGSSRNTFKCGPVVATISKGSESFDNVFFQYRSKANTFDSDFLFKKPKKTNLRYF
jgi:hypothetical protein